MSEGEERSVAVGGQVKYYLKVVWARGVRRLVSPDHDTDSVVTSLIHRRRLPYVDEEQSYPIALLISGIVVRGMLEIADWRNILALEKIRNLSIRKVGDTATPARHRSLESLKEDLIFLRFPSIYLQIDYSGIRRISEDNLLQAR